MIGFILLTVGVVLAVLMATELVPSLAPATARMRQLQSPASQKPASHLQGIASQLDPLLKTLSITRKIDQRLAQVRLPWTPAEFVLGSALISLGGGAVGGILLASPTLALALAALGAVLPTLWLRKKCRDHVKTLNEQLPDAIMLIINSLRAGNGFLQTLQLVARQLPDPIASEFDDAVREINWGMSVETALLNLQARFGSVDMELVVSSVLIQRETGGNLTEILSNIHDAIRERVRILGEVQTLTAEGRLSGWIMGALPIALALAFFAINPAYIRLLFSDPRGQMLVAAAVTMEILGGLVIRRIVQIRY